MWLNNVECYEKWIRFCNMNSNIKFVSEGLNNEIIISCTLLCHICKIFKPGILTIAFNKPLRMFSWILNT